MKSAAGTKSRQAERDKDESSLLSDDEMAWKDNGYSPGQSSNTYYKNPHGIPGSGYVGINRSINN
jgi:hypothetical protein